jgi:predicted kinase
MPVLTIMTGLPGSGKSTKAKQILFDDRAGVILATDDYWSAGQHYFFDQTRLGDAHRWNQWRCEQAMLKELNPIIDNTNLTFKEMKSYVDLAIKYNYEIRLAQSETRWKDNEKVCFVLNTHNVPWETMEKMKERQKTMWELEVELINYLTLHNRNELLELA